MKRIVYLFFTLMLSKNGFTQCNIITANDVDYCGVDDATLSSSIPTGNCSFIWYDQPVGGTQLERGCNYYIDNLFCGDFQYYIEDTSKFDEQDINAGYAYGDPTIGASNSGLWNANAFRTFFTNSKTIRLNSVTVNFQKRNWDCDANKIFIELTQEDGTNTNYPIFLPCGVGIETAIVPINIEIPPGNHEIKITGESNLVMHNNNAGVDYNAGGNLDFGDIRLTGNGHNDNHYGGLFNWDVTVLNPCPRKEVKLFKSCVTPEICDNGIDDDCDGLIDCEDPDCSAYIDCENHNYTNIHDEESIIICQGDNVIIQGDHLTNGIWDGNNFVLINDSTINATPAVTTKYYQDGGIFRGENLVVNGDFESGATGFTSEYNLECNPLPIFTQGDYCIHDNPMDLNRFFQDCKDHSGTGDMFITDGATIAGAEVWCQDIPVTPGTDYEFSAWITTVLNINPSILRFEINGGLIGAPLNAPSASCDWANYAATWNSGLEVNARICLINDNIVAGGNDFGLDDIEFIPLIPVVGQIDSIEVIVQDCDIPCLVELNDAPINICAGDSFKLDDRFINSTAKGEWEIDSFPTMSLSANLQIESSDTIFTTAKLTEPGVYKLKFKTTEGTERCYDSLYITVNELPNVNLGPDRSICSESPEEIFDAGIFDAYNWYIDAAGNTQTFQSNAVGTFAVEVENSNGCKDSDTVALIHLPVPNVDLGPDKTICFGDPEEVFNAGAFDSYHWFIDAVGDEQTYQSNTAGTFAVEVKNIEGCADSDTVVLIVHDLPIADLGPDDTICFGAADVVFDAGPFDQFKWFEDAVGNTQTFQSNTAGTFSVEVTDMNGCKDSDSVILTVVDLPTPTLEDQTICPGMNHPFTVAAYDDGYLPHTYNWSTGDNTAEIIVNIAGNYWVDVTNKFGCVGRASSDLIIDGDLAVQIFSAPEIQLCEGEDTILKTNYNTADGYNFLWSDLGGGQNTETITTEPISGRYQVRVDNGMGCEGTAEINVIINPLPNPDPLDAEFCEGQSVNISAGLGAGFDYLWNNGEITEIIEVNSANIASPYTVTATNILTGCSNQANAIIDENPNPIVILEDVEVCEGEVVELKSSEAYVAVTYLWTGGANTESINPVANGVYTLTVTTDKGCTENDNALVTFNPIPVVNLGPNVTICEGEDHTFTTGDQTGTITWNTGDNTQEITGNSSFIYNVSVIENGCEATDDVELTVTPVPKSELDHSLSEAPICFGKLPRGIYLEAGSDLSYNYLWNTGSDENGVLVDSKGIYKVEISAGSCKVNDSITLKDYCPWSLYLPNTFTPNNDGINETFPSTFWGDFLEYELLIFNRWGEQIFKTTDINTGWDGTYMGNDCQIDVYVYKIYYRVMEEDGSSEIIPLVGRVNLIR